MLQSSIISAHARSPLPARWCVFGIVRIDFLIFVCVGDVGRLVAYERLWPSKVWKVAVVVTYRMQARMCFHGIAIARRADWAADCMLCAALSRGRPSDSLNMCISLSGTRDGWRRVAQL